MWGFHLRMNLLAQLTQQCKTNFRRNNLGAVAQLGERLHGMQEVVGSSPIGSTRSEKNQSLRGWFFFFAVWIRVPAAPSLCCLWQQLARVRIALRQFDCEPDRLHSLRKKPITSWLVFLLRCVDPCAGCAVTLLPLAATCSGPNCPAAIRLRARSAPLAPNKPITLWLVFLLSRVVLSSSFM